MVVIEPVRLRLKIETAALHRNLEEGLALVDSPLSLDRYRRILESLFGYYAPLEPRIAQLAPSAPPLGVEMPPRAPLLARDLIALGHSESAIAALRWCSDLPRLSEPAHFAGCLYVLEGARLGGVIIARALERTLGIGPDDGASFFCSDGEVVARRWKHVLVWLDEVAHSGAPVDGIVDAARATFRTLSRWTEACGAWR